MKNIILYIAQSLDGFVATKDGSVAWLDKFNDGEDYGYEDFMKKIDTIIQGNTTYQQFKPKYPGKNSYVFTHNPSKYSEEETTFVEGNVKNFIESLDNKTHKNIWMVGGPSLLTHFMNENLIDELIIFTMPVLLNEGIKLFEKISVNSKIVLNKVEQFKNGVIESIYVIEK